MNGPITSYKWRSDPQIPVEVIRTIASLEHSVYSHISSAVKKAQSGARSKRTISNLSSATRSALGSEGAKAAARKRGATKGTGSGAGAMTVTELRREAARLGIDGRSKMGKAQLIRAVGQKRRSTAS